MNVNPYYPNSSVEGFAKTHPALGRRFIYPANTGRGPLLLDIQYGHPPQSQAAVMEKKDIRAWADFKHGGATGVNTSFTIAGLWPPAGTGYWLADEGGFTSLLAVAK